MRWASSQLVCFALFWIAFFTNNANAQTYCSGTKLLTTLSGNITDHTGSGNYNDDMDCVWVIKPGNTTVTSITLSFQKFDLEYNYDTVVIYNCECNDVAKQYIWFTGSTIPQDVIVPGNVVTVEFFSDGGVTGAGFSLSYYANNCPNGCNGKGTCHMDHCDCYPGYNGTDCSQTYCYNNCSYPNGECNQGANSCVCDFGYYGGDCAQAYCTGTSTIGDDSGSFTDHHGYGDYLNNMNCQWLIQPNPPRQSITLSFSYFDTEAGYDFITIYDGNTTQSQVIGKYSGSNLPPSSTAISGAMLVVWTSDVGITRTGFDATFSGTDCPAGCNGQGDCINGDCHCDIGFTGTDCSNTTCTDNCFGRGICEQPEQVCNCTTTNFVGANCGSCVLEDESCQIGFCYPYFHAHNLTGVVSDKIWGEGNYMPGMECKWTIDPVPYNPGLPISGLALSFTQLELELNQAHVHVFRGDSTADEDLIGLYTGEEIPPIINLDDTVMTIVFTSSGSSIVRQGWKAEWSITYCATNCNGNGVCTLGNICECYPGWDGNDCSISVCVGTCNSPAGQCINDHCVCEPGWYSPSCSSTFCSGLTTLDGDFGTVRDHADGETYRSNSDCDFRMSHANTSETYSFVWTQFDLDGSLGDTVDYVSLYDGSSPQSAVLLSHRTGPFLPHPVRSQNNSLYLKFNSGDEVNFPGFVAVYTANSKCPGSCSGKGYCYNGTCICDQGTTGSDCATKATATKVEFDVQLNASVSSFQWNYYSFKTPKNVESLLIIAYQTSNQGNSEFYIKAHDFPGLYDYEIFYGMGTEGISVKNPPEESTIYLGVYENSLEYSNYTINISVEKGSVVDYRGAAIALLVLVFVFFGLAGVCVFVLWKKTRKLKQQQREETGLPEQTQEMGSVPQQQGPGYARFQDE